jgi:AGCS family alanine or glycine:cation symporter
VTLEHILERINDLSAVPATILFFLTAIILTFKTGFLQIRGIPYFWNILKKDFAQSSHETSQKVVPPFQALFTAMASTIGMGNLVVPAIAIYMGGPGALLWLLVYIFFGAATRFAEVCYALYSRTTLADGTVIGGPMQYLSLIHKWLGIWYMFVIAFLYVSWSAIQSNTLALIYAQEAVPHWMIGFLLAVTVIIVLQGGVKRVGIVASKMVPVMFGLYLIFGLIIIVRNLEAAKEALLLIIRYAFASPYAPLGGILGGTMLQAMRAGIYRGIYITEAGLGTSSIAHAVADTKIPSEQGILALFSMMSDAFLSFLSGMLVLITGVWLYGDFRSTFIYEAFKAQAPCVGNLALLLTVTLFVLTTVIGNTFNGRQSFTLLTNNRWVTAYMILTVAAIFFGALVSVKVIWIYIDLLLTLIAIPNVIGLLILAFKYPKVLRLHPPVK